MRGKIYSQELGINLKSGKEAELFKWFLACLLFGKPIQQEVAKRTYFEFVKAGLISPEKILRAGWNKLVKVLDKGHYVRYDFSTATKLLDISKELKEKYGSVSKMISGAKTQTELRKRLIDVKWVGPVTAKIFLRALNHRS